MKFSEFIDWCIIVFIGTVILILNSSCGGSPQPLPPTQTFTTDKGATVHVIQGQNPTPADLAEIDRQIDRVTEIANRYAAANSKTYHWPAHDRHVIEIVLPNNGPGECETPGSFKTDAGQYGGDTICVAGRYYPTTDRIRTTLEALWKSRAIQYESEHFGLKLNDSKLYAETLTHQPPNGHPIFGVD